MRIRIRFQQLFGLSKNGHRRAPSAFARAFEPQGISRLRGCVRTRLCCGCVNGARSRTAPLAVENPIGFPTARRFAHSLHSLTIFDIFIKWKDTRNHSPRDRGCESDLDVLSHIPRAAAQTLRTVCEEAACPNIGECWSKKHATMMIMGAVCTRACTFYNVATGKPGALDPFEPTHVGTAVARLGLAHVVITSVDRDDLADGGAGHFAAVIQSHPRSDAGHEHRGADPRLPAQARCGRDRRCGQAGCLQSQPGDRAAALCLGATGRARAISIPCACSTGSSNWIPRCSPSPASWSAWERAGARSARSWTTCARPMSIS